MIVLEIIQYCLAAVLGILLGYQMILSFLAIVGGRINNIQTEKNRKFAIVIPASDDNKVIAKSLYSISGMVYPKNMYDLIVLADNCTDSSIKIARNLGATVLERSNNLKNSKSSSLQWAIDQILSWDKNYDAVVLFDSNSLVSGNYLEVMNYYLEQGNKVVQSSGLIPPKTEGWTEIEWIGFLLDNYVKPMGRKVLGLGVGLLGTGMCFTTEVLRQIPWRTPSLADDFGYELTLYLKGVKIEFSPEAYAWIQRPKAKTGKLQRYQWPFSSYPIIRKYAFKLLAAAFRKKPVKYFDRFIDLITPSFVESLLLIGLLCGVNGLLILQGWISVTFLWIWLGVAGIGILYLLLGVIAVRKNSEYTMPAQSASKAGKIKEEMDINSTAK